MSLKKTPSIIDLGSGFGYFLSAFPKSWNKIGVEISKNLNIYSSKHGNIYNFDLEKKIPNIGKFDVILENLKFIKSIKNFQFHLHMVVQNDNWHEMPLMLELADTVNADKVFFNSIQDWNTQSNFEKQDYFSKKDFKNLYDTCKLHTKFRGWTLS